ncbi:MAG: hypothetical protein ACR2G3_00635 [Solirubrobacterales bacterium]
MSAVQLTLDGLPLDPRELAQLSILERADLYEALDLHPLQRAAAEEAARLVLARRYPGRRPA